MAEKIPPCFKAYDIRGRVPEDIDARLARALGGAIAARFAAARVAIGHDPRLSGPELEAALAAGLESAGVEVAHLGLCGTEETYFAAANGDYDLCVMITGSHNPANENGFKLVRRGAIPVSGDSGLKELGEKTMELMSAEPPCSPAGASAASSAAAGRLHAPLREKYLDWLLDYSGIAGKPGKKLRVFADAGNGSAGPVIARLAQRLPFDVIIGNPEPDGNFPNGVPNPLLPERREETAKNVRAHGADVGVAFDGDFDRCFFYDENGSFVEGYYLVGLLARELLRGRAGSRIIHDPRVYWNTREQVLAAGGVPVMAKTGHAFMKERMRAENALYGGEMSAHHYFRDFAYCDSGMLAMLIVLGFLAGGGESLAEFAGARMRAYPCSGEINFRVQNAAEIMESAWARYLPDASAADRTDGINLEFPSWRFNLRMSNTEPLLRLNLESRGDRDLMLEKTAELEKFIRQGL